MSEKKDIVYIVCWKKVDERPANTILLEAFSTEEKAKRFIEGKSPHGKWKNGVYYTTKDKDSWYVIVPMIIDAEEVDNA